MESHFLSAAWNNLIMLNYPVPADLLMPYLPGKTQLDLFQQKPYVSLVGFMFLNTKILGYGIPYHIDFEEVNLRFYVKHDQNGKTVRGVTFIKEIVPKPAIAILANNIYREKYVTMKMKHSHNETEEGLETEYQWKFKNQWNKIATVSEKKSFPLRPGSEEEFIAEHYWGFTKVSATKTSAYEVQHRPWEIFRVKDYVVDCNFAGIYGEKFSFLKDTKPSSVFMAKGSEVKIFRKALL